MNGLRALTLTTIQAPIQDFIIEGLADYLAVRLGIQTRFLIDIPWEARARRIDAGEIDLAWICGLPYIKRADRGSPEIELLAAPVMAADRYQDRPVYFSDVIVRAGQPIGSFNDLRGHAWAYNEPGSHSGYNITRYHLAKIGAENPFFSRVIPAGSHQRCIQMVLAGDVDAAAIDSTVLDLVREVDMRIDQELRIVEVFGPSPIPPLVISKRIAPTLRNEIRDQILAMHNDHAGQKLLARWKLRRFQPVNDHDYDAIREMAREAEGVSL